VVGGHGFGEAVFRHGCEIDPLPFFIEQFPQLFEVDLLFEGFTTGDGGLEGFHHGGAAGRFRKGVVRGQGYAGGGKAHLFIAFGDESQAFTFDICHRGAYQLLLIYVFDDGSRFHN